LNYVRTCCSDINIKSVRYAKGKRPHTKFLCETGCKINTKTHALALLVIVMLSQVHLVARGVAVMTKQIEERAEEAMKKIETMKSEIVAAQATEEKGKIDEKEKVGRIKTEIEIETTKGIETIEMVVEMMEEMEIEMIEEIGTEIEIEMIEEIATTEEIEMRKEIEMEKTKPIETMKETKTQDQAKKTERIRKKKRGPNL